MGEDRGGDQRTFPISVGSTLDELRVLMAAIDNASAAADRTPFRDARLFAEAQVAARGELTALSAEVIFAHWRKFETFLAKGHGVVFLGEVTPAMVHGFINARTPRGTPAIATRRSRCSSLRMFFRELRQFQLYEGDPTIDVVLPNRPMPGIRALTDEEVQAGEWAALASLISTREPATWALAETGASSFEVGRVQPHDFDAGTGIVWLHGGPRTVARSAVLTEWGRVQVARRCRSPRVYVVSDGDGPLPGSRVAGTIATVLRRAGLGDRREIAPRSLAAWAGLRLLRETGRIESVARGLGMRSLDLAAELIGHDWRSEQV